MLEVGYGSGAGKIALCALAPANDELLGIDLDAKPETFKALPTGSASIEVLDFAD